MCERGPEQASLLGRGNQGRLRQDSGRAASGTRRRSSRSGISPLSPVISMITEDRGRYVALAHISGWLRVGILAGQEDALAEKREGGASVHLAFEQLGAGVEAFDQAGVPGHGQAVADGLVVLADAGGEGVQVGLAGVG